jgi:hypothetical protein
MNRKGLISFGVLVTVGKIVAVLALTFLLARCSNNDSSVIAPPMDTQLGEFDYSLGKSATHKNSNKNLSPQNYSYGRNRK